MRIKTYDPDKRVLAIVLQDGREVVHGNVTPSEYHQLVRSAGVAGLRMEDIERGVTGNGAAGMNQYYKNRIANPQQDRHPEWSKPVIANATEMKAYLAKIEETRSVKAAPDEAKTSTGLPAAEELFAAKRTKAAAKAE